MLETLLPVYSKLHAGVSMDDLFHHLTFHLAQMWPPLQVSVRPDVVLGTVSLILILTLCL